MSISKENKVEYQIYHDIKKRCYNSNCNNYSNYGGKGIQMSNEWFNSFETFLNDMGKRPSKNLSIERVNNKENYSKDNCKWATSKEQANNRSSNTLVTYKGKIDTISNWCSKLGLEYSRVIKRISCYKWSIERAFETIENNNETLIEFNGRRMSIKKWAEETGIGYNTLKNRIFTLKWSVEEALTIKILI